MTELNDSAARYLDLLKKCLTRIEFGERHEPVNSLRWHTSAVTNLLSLLLARWRIELVRAAPVDRERRALGLDWPVDAETMIGIKRLDNLQQCIKDVVDERVPGDVIETGVWRGGATIFMRAALDAFGASDRIVYAADSFEGLPPANSDAYPADAGDIHHTHEELKVGLEIVKENFRRYGLLDERTKFIVGWFKDTLPDAPFSQLAILRLDGDMYESTMDALRPCYPRLSTGGYVIVDDYHVVPGCKQAVEDYRKEFGITDPLLEIDGSAVYWRRAG